MEIKSLHGKKIMVDTNAFIYYLTGQCNKLILEIFEAGVLKKLKFITTMDMPPFLDRTFERRLKKV